MWKLQLVLSVWFPVCSWELCENQKYVWYKSPDFNFKFNPAGKEECKSNVGVENVVPWFYQQTFWINCRCCWGQLIESRQQLCGLTGRVVKTDMIHIKWTTLSVTDNSQTVKSDGLHWHSQDMTRSQFCFPIQSGFHTSASGRQHCSLSLAELYSNLPVGRCLGQLNSRLIMCLWI